MSKIGSDVFQCAHNPDFNFPLVILFFTTSIIPFSTTRQTYMLSFICKNNLLSLMWIDKPINYYDLYVHNVAN